MNEPTKPGSITPYDVGEVAVVEQPTPMSLIAELARDPDFDEKKMAVMERLMAMKERHDASEARARFRIAMRQVREETPPIPKTKPVRDRNGALMYKFADIDDVRLIVDPILDKHGFFYTFTSEIQGGVEMQVCVMNHDGGHTECTAQPVKNMKLPHGTPSTEHGGGVTFARRYALTGATGVRIVGEDTNTEPMKTLSDEQIDNIDSLIKSFPGVEKHTPAMLKWLNAEKIEDIPAARYNEVCRKIRGKARQM